MIAFGIDPGSRRTGWGVVRAEGSKLVLVEFGVVTTDQKAPLHERLVTIFDELTKTLKIHTPDHAFIESVFHSKSIKSALVLGQARGVGLLAAARTGCPLIEVTPAEVKKAVTGNGRAEKLQVQEMVKMLLGLRERAPSDAADALAVAIAGISVARWKASVEANR